MPTHERKLQADLLGPVEKLENAEVPVSVNCPTCRSGIIDVPDAIRADIVDVDL